MGKILYVSDLDGTLLGPDAELSSVTVDILNRLLDRGLMFTFATARSFISAGRVTAELDLRLPVATYNGAFLVDPVKSRVIESRIMDRAGLAGLFAIIREKGVTPLVYALIEGRERVSWLRGRETRELENYLESRVGDPRLRAAAGYEQLFEGDTFCITIINPGENLAAVRGEVDSNPHLARHVQQDTYNADELWFEIYRHDATKRQAVQSLQALTGAEEVVCFGDNINDIPMFGAADRGYAVDNACAELRSLATRIIRANFENGVARWLEQNFKD